LQVEILKASYKLDSFKENSPIEESAYISICIKPDMCAFRIHALYKNLVIDKIWGATTTTTNCKCKPT